MNVRRQSLTLLATSGLLSLGACKDDDGGETGASMTMSTTDASSGSEEGVTESNTMPSTMTSSMTTDPSETDPDTTMTETMTTVDPDSSTGTPGDLVAFRFTSLYVRDPHFFLDIPINGCQDGTDTEVSVPLMDPVAPVNQQFNDAIGMDDAEMPDGNLDLSLLLLFRPLDQGGDGSIDFANGACLVPAEATVCDLLDGTELYSTMYATMADGTCQEPMAADLSPAGYNPTPGTTTGPCFTAGPASVVIQTSFAALPLDNATIAAQFVGDPSDELVQGTIRGFITTANADAIMLPPPISQVAMTLGDILPGDPECCAPHSDLDGEGWWFYADFTATTVPWNGA
ncbi:MAG TPA: hypothetical protein VG755_11730 [Nannocystaceae bacterium]|nr:hypothetical protein [Nannocystaceae bacterium]